MHSKFLRGAAIVLTAVLVIAVSAPVVHAKKRSKSGMKSASPVEVVTFGHLRARGEYGENINDLQDHVAGGSSDFLDDSSKYFPVRGLVGIDAYLKNDISATVSLQNTSIWGEDPPARTGQGPFDQGSESGGGSDDLAFYEVFVDVNDIGSTNHDIRFGRAEHKLGCELHMGDNDFYGGQTFDGARFTLQRERVDVDFFKYRIDAFGGSGLPCQAFCGDDNVDFSGIVANWSGDDGRAEFEPYLLMYRDAADFTSLGGPSFIRGVRTNTLGARLTQKPQKDNSNSHWDYNGELAFQFGEVDPNGANLDHSAYIVEGWGGYNFPLGNSTGRAHLGILMASGDDNPSDTDVDAFFTLFPDGHSYNRLGDMDVIGSSDTSTALGAINTVGQNLGGLSNLTDYNIGFSSRNENRKYGIALHMLELSEEFGPGFDSDIGMEIDLKYSRRFADNFWGQAGLAYFTPGDAAEQFLGITDADNAMRFWIHTQVDF